ncbi:MAG: YkgJ family cysteine cluster protein [Steroidobacteraceae bacterium]
MSIHFNCTRCGKCCRDLKIPLTVAEAMAWLDRGHQVQLICEASPWPARLTDQDPRAAHFERRSFAVMSGSMPARVIAMLVADVTGPCPNLLADFRCGIYRERPLVCRIYPAEVNPLIELNPETKLCPPEAWAADRPLLQGSDGALSSVTQQDIRGLRAADALDAGAKIRLCAALQVADAGLVHESVVVYSPPRQTLRSALAIATAAEGDPDVPTPWRFVSDRPETIRDLTANGAIARHVSDTAGGSFQHLNFTRQALFRSYPGSG